MNAQLRGGRAAKVPRTRKGAFNAKRWFCTAFALSMMTVVGAGFLPSLAITSRRRAPLSALAAVHGAIFFAWLILFLVQSRFIAGSQIKAHKRLGIAACCVAGLMIPIGYMTCMSMVRRGFDLSGDLHAERDPAYAVVFPLCDLFFFLALVIAAVAYRRRPDMHKRLMLFANIALMSAPLAHFIGHVSWLAALPGSIIMIPISLFLAAAVAREYITLKKVHPLTWTIAAGMLLFGPLRAGIIGPSGTWHRLVYWLAR